MLLLWILAVLLGIYAIMMFIGWYLSAPVYKGPESDHFKNGKFFTPNGAPAKGPADVFKWLLKRDQGPWTKNYETFVGPKPATQLEDLNITYVNHSTFLIQWNLLNILTDPVWSERVSPFSFAGPQRMRPPGLNFDELPNIDIVLLSHNHYDHLDITTVIKIEKNWSPLFIVPLGVKAYLTKNGIQNVLELDWWQETQTGIKIQSVPAQHFTSRGMFDRDKTLWCGYVLEVSGKKLYFAGDSGYNEFFKEIGKKCGPMDVSLIPIGAYAPEWFMSPIHVNPKQAVQIHKDVKSKQSIAMHFGTFPLADEGQGKAESELILELDRQNIPQKDFILPEEGVVIAC